MFDYTNSSSSTTPHQSTTKCALLLFSLAISSTVFASPPNEYIKSLTVNRIGQGPIYGNGVMTAKISIGYEVADGYSAIPKVTGYGIVNTNEPLLISGWREEEHDNGYSHQSGFNSYSIQATEPLTSGSKQYITKYIGPDKGTFGSVEFCITQRFRIYQENSDGTSTVINENYLAKTCDSGNIDSSVTLTSIPPVYLTNENFYFEDYVNVYDNSFTRVDYRELFSTNQTPQIASIKYLYAPYLTEDNQFMRVYDKSNDKGAVYVDTYFFHDRNNSNYSFVSKLYSLSTAISNGNIDFDLEERSINSNNSSNYIGTFINRKLKNNKSYFKYSSTCTDKGDYSICYDDKYDDTYSTTNNFNYSGDIAFAFLKVTDIYGTTSSIQFKYDKQSRMIELSNESDH
ncbi:hypothetical protein [Vibrio navarrensis]|uniref:hypothetical protein n=1 Tax=Vibrio navarrensis TaxID=29495 RepID=UPI00130264D4|nr:hypothetical protein [Vibrio navarrensis]